MVTFLYLGILLLRIEVHVLGYRPIGANPIFKIDFKIVFIDQHFKRRNATIQLKLKGVIYISNVSVTIQPTEWQEHVSAIQSPFCRLLVIFNF